MRRVSYDSFEWCQLSFAGDRIGIYDRALRAAVRPGSTVIDIGTGLGIFALLACRYGAGKVYAIESDRVIQLAREAAAANGLAGRIEFIHGDSRQIALPDRADVIVCDLKHVLPELQIPVMIDARRRLLAPGGVLIPRTDRLWAAAVHSPTAYDSIVGVWDHHPHGLNTETLRRRVVHAWTRARFTRDDLLTAPACWATLDYHTIENAEVIGAMSAEVTRRGIAHGLSVWFDAELADGALLTNRPGESRLWYGTAFLPFPEPVVVEAGDGLSASFRISAADPDCRRRWQVIVSSRSGAMKARFDQDTERMTMFDDVARSGAEDMAPRDDDLRIDRLVLQEMDRGLSIGVIAARLVARFPDRFVNPRDALTRVGALSQRWG